MGLTCLVLGGAKSGKSAFAQTLAEAMSPRRTFVATAEMLDDEMAERVRAHQAARGDSWRTVEAPFDPAAALKEIDEAGAVVIVDCLTLWLSNLMTRQGLGATAARSEVARLADVLPGLQSAVIVVSNEVGWGIVPADPLTRAWRDLAGWANQRLAAVADRVVLVAAGLALDLKRK